MNDRLEYPWWSGFITLLLVCGSLWMTSWGSWLVATGWEPVAAYSLIGVFAVCNIAAVCLGFVAATNWQNNAKSAAAIALAVALAAAVLSAIGTQRALTNMFEQNADALRVETTTDANADRTLRLAEQRIASANNAIAPLEAKAKSAEAEFKREAASGYGPRATERKTEWDAAIAALQQAQNELLAAERAAAQIAGGAVVTERSDAALVAAKTTELERRIQIYLGTFVIEALPILAGWLFAIRVAGRETELPDRILALEAHLYSQQQATPVEQPLFAAQPEPPRLPEPPPEPAPVEQPLFDAPPPLTTAEKKADVGKRMNDLWKFRKEADASYAASPPTASRGEGREPGHEVRAPSGTVLAPDLDLSELVDPSKRMNGGH